ncbi:PIN domain-containing protein [Glycomyces tarimensis]
MAERSETMGLRDGFEAFLTPTRADYISVMKDGIVVPDTNVLLNLYRYDKEARDSLFSVLRALKGSLWVPHQVAEEFWRNRESVLGDPQSSESTIKDIKKQANELEQTFRSWVNRVGFPKERSTEILSGLTDSTEAFVKVIREVAEGVGLQDAADSAKDPVLNQLLDLLEGKVGMPYELSVYEGKLKESEARAKRRQPPGYLDQAKGGERAAGDFLVWTQAIDEVKRRRKNLLIVTDDAKDDWWRKHEGKTRGPRQELISELNRHANARLFMTRPENLVNLAKEAFKLDVSEKTVKEIARVSRIQAEMQFGGWNLAALEYLLQQLIEEGWNDQEAVIHEAAYTEGVVSRDRVYEISGFPSTRTLKGFTRPISRISTDLRESGRIPEDAVEVLFAEYDDKSPNPGWASGFRLHEDLMPLVEELDLLEDEGR